MSHTRLFKVDINRPSLNHEKKVPLTPPKLEKVVEEKEEKIDFQYKNGKG